jgi:alpha-galactosidase/6-phospho-beta-glucosidase family protein
MLARQKNKPKKPKQEKTKSKLKHTQTNQHRTYKGQNKMEEKSNKQSYRTHIRLSENEFQRLEEDSQIQGATIPELMKKTYFKGPIVRPLLTKEDSIKLMTELKRIGNNVNQIARHLNSGIREGFHKELEQVYEQLFLLSQYISGAYGHR